MPHGAVPRCVSRGLPVRHQIRLLGRRGAVARRITVQAARWPQYFADDSRDLDSITQRLWGLLNERIRKGEFSPRRRSNEEFNDDDRAFVKRAFERADEDT